MQSPPIDGQGRYEPTSPRISKLTTSCTYGVQVCKEAGLSGWQLYLVDWGYNTQQERSTAAQNDRIAVVDMHTLQQICGHQ